MILNISAKRKCPLGVFREPIMMSLCLARVSATLMRPHKSTSATSLHSGDDVSIRIGVDEEHPLMGVDRGINPWHLRLGLGKNQPAERRLS
mmetsp:Transcript_26116/g.85812  ORF Transcript_26116/g.85812 Transcript_26116/m.85812 type:complete len:91 (+) Transcript_26116:71-343(+)